MEGSLLASGLSGRHVSSSGEKQPRHLGLVLVQPGPVLLLLLLLLPGLGGAGLLLTTPVEGSEALRVSPHHLRPGLNEPPRGLDVALGGRPVQGKSPSRVWLVGISPGLQQSLDDLSPSVDGAVVEGQHSELVWDLNICSSLHQGLDEFDVTVPASFISLMIQS